MIMNNMFYYIFNKLKPLIKDLINDTVKDEIQECVGVNRHKMFLFWSSYEYEVKPTGIYKELEQIREYLGVELVKTDATEKLVAKKKKK